VKNVAPGQVTALEQDAVDPLVRFVVCSRPESRAVEVGPARKGLRPPATSGRKFVNAYVGIPAAELTMQLGGGGEDATAHSQPAGVVPRSLVMLGVARRSARRSQAKANPHPGAGSRRRATVRNLARRDRVGARTDETGPVENPSDIKDDRITTATHGGQTQQTRSGCRRQANGDSACLNGPQ
jgi:hypothetical protein